MTLYVETDKQELFLEFLKLLKKDKMIKEFKMVDEDLEDLLLLEQAKKEKNEFVDYEEVAREYGIETGQKGD